MTKSTRGMGGDICAAAEHREDEANARADRAEALAAEYRADSIRLAKALDEANEKLEAAEELADEVAVYFEPSMTFPSTKGMCRALAKYQETALAEEPRLKVARLAIKADHLADAVAAYFKPSMSPKLAAHGMRSALADYYAFKKDTQ